MNAVQVVGLDIGYGFTKVMSGDAYDVFPSVVGDSIKAGYDNDLIKASLGKTITIQGNDWITGDRGSVLCSDGKVGYQRCDSTLYRTSRRLVRGQRQIDRDSLRGT